MIEPGHDRQARAAGRDRVLQSAVVVSPRGSHAVRVRDHSKSGVHVVADETLPCDVDALFCRAGMFQAARIVWSKDNEAGLRFYRELE